MAEQAEAPQGATEDGSVIFIDEKERLKQAITALHAANGLSKPDGSPDNAARISRVAGLLNTEDHVTYQPSDRKVKAKHQANLVLETFTKTLVGPGGYSEIEDKDERVWAEKVYNRAAALVRNDTKMDKSGKVQRLVGEANGLPEMILCWTKLGNDQIPAVYLTRDLRCLLLDNSKRLNDILLKDAEKSASNLAEWITRVPEHAEALEKDYRKGMKAALEAGQKILTAAVEKALLMRENGDTPDGGDAS